MFCSWLGSPAYLQSLFSPLQPSCSSLRGQLPHPHSYPLLTHTSPCLPHPPFLHSCIPHLFPPGRHPGPRWIFPQANCTWETSLRERKWDLHPEGMGHGTSEHQENPVPQSCCFAALFSFAVLAAGGAPEQTLHTNTHGSNSGAQLHQLQRSPRKSSGSLNCLPRGSAAQSQFNIPIAGCTSFPEQGTSATQPGQQQCQPPAPTLQPCSQNPSNSSASIQPQAETVAGHQGLTLPLNTTFLPSFFLRESSQHPLPIPCPLHPLGS